MYRAASFLCALSLLCLTACGIGGGDYLDADLRARVDQLKADAAQQPTTRDNLAERLPVFTEWSDAFALSGGALPVHVTFATAMLNQALTDNAEPDPWMLAELNKFIKELTVKDEQPDAMGSLALDPTDPIAAASWQTIEQTWTVGVMPMTDGGAVLLGRQLQANQGLYQHRDPAADNFVSIRSSNPAATFEALEMPLRGLHGGFRDSTQMPAFRLRGATLSPGDTVTVTYGDTSGGSRGFRIQTESTDRLMFPLYLDLAGNGNFFTPVWPALEVVGIEPHSVRAVAPSVVAPGEVFELMVRTEDRYFNRARGPIPGYEIKLNYEPFNRIEAGDNPLIVLDDLAIDKPGVYRFEVRAEDDSMSCLSNPVWVRNDPPHRIYWGETHGHTDFADGQGSPEHFFRYGREDARLDFFSLSEHDLMMDASEWRRLQELTREYTEEGRLVTYLGYEWTVERDRGGHHNVLFRTPDRDIVGIHRANLLPELYRLLAAENEPEDVLIIPHAHQAGDWTQNDPDLERLVEVYSMHGTFEWFGNLYLQNGFEVGFVAASDDHRAKGGYAQGRPRAPLAQRGGLAAVMAPAKTVDGIFDSLRSLSAYATSGQRIILDADLNGSPMGTRQASNEVRHITCRAMGTSPIDTIDVIKNGELVFRQEYSQAPLERNTWILVGFESSSEVFGDVRDNPRPYRIWRGTLRVDGARIVRVDPIGLDNVYLDGVERDPNNPGLIRFNVETRGRRDTLLLELDEASAATSLSFTLEPTTEYGFAPPIVRRPAALPGDDFRVRLSEMTAERWERRFAVGDHTDRLTLQIASPAGMMDRELEFTDVKDPRPGDYYYVRVTQLDGARAWSSPFWVGRKSE